MQSQDRALMQICHFLSGESGAWTAKDLKDLAAIQATCSDARTLCARACQQRKPAARAYKKMMRQLKDYFDYRVEDARESALCFADSTTFKHPFTGESLPLYTPDELRENEWFEKAEAAAARAWEEQWEREMTEANNRLTAARNRLMT